MLKTFPLRLHRMYLLVAVGLVVVGCDSVTENDDATDIEFALSGSLTTDFKQMDSAYEGIALFSRTGIANRLDVTLEAKGQSGERREQARVSFRFAYASNTGVLPPGYYSVVPDDDVPTVGDAYYQLVRSESSYSTYQFEGSSLQLEVEESPRGRFVARFSLTLDQTLGEAYTDGQLLTVELAGQVRASGAFNIAIEGLEPLPGL
ncbi:MAG: hypothetical protein HKN13_12050 [Rhodothermales bacterium]|nr:hypothetical protein [Rhodothermales bacterium]